MTFNSLAFVVFFAVVYLLYVTLTHRSQNVLLLVASIFFYGWWDWRFLSLLFASILIDYTCARLMENCLDPWRRKVILVVALTGDLGILFTFKYFNFFCENAAAVLNMLGFEAHWATLAIVLPLGISFYTFQALSYTVDVYRGHTQPMHSLFDFSLYVLYFPQLVAGPIERSTNLVPMILNPRHLTWDKTRAGLGLILSGYFKKIVVADNLAPMVQAVFDTPNPQLLNGVDVLLAVYAFGLQIYGDFAGYSDIARGLAKLMGFELMLNFRRPYFATNPSDLWRRWHISLSSWLRDYLYIPLGGNRGSRSRTMVNLLLTMTLGGLWHGAAIHFVLWGVYHGGLLAIHRGLERGTGWWQRCHVVVGRRVWRVLAIVGMFHLTSYGWLLFRADGWQRVQVMSQRLVTGFHLDGWHPVFLATLVFYGGVLAVYEILQEISYQRHDREGCLAWWITPVVYAYMLAMILFHGAIEGAEFIYFQF